MKFPAAVLFCLTIPLAAAAGWYGRRMHQNRHQSPDGGGAGTAESVSTASGKPVSPELAYAPSGVVKHWADRMRNATAAELPGIYAEIQALSPKAEPPLPGATRQDQWARQIRLQSEARTALRLLCARWAELDAPGGLAFFIQDREKDKNKDSGATGLLLLEWAMLDQDSAFEAIDKLPEKDRQLYLSSVGYQLMEDNPDRFWAWFEKARVPWPSSDSQGGLWQKLAAEHFDELSGMAADLLASTKLPKDGRSVESYQLESFYSLLGGAFAGKDFDKAVAWAKEQPESVRNQALQGALRQIVRTAPEKILDYVTDLKAKQISPNSYISSGAGPLITEAMKRLSERDPLLAMKWLGENTGKMGDESYHGTIALGEELNKAIGKGILSPRQAFEAALATNNSLLGMNVVSSLWGNLPAEQCAGTADWLMTNGASPEIRQQALQGLFSNWLDKDRAGALKFAAGVKDPALAAKLYGGVASKSWSGSLNAQPEQVAADYRDVPPSMRAGFLEEFVKSNFSDDLGEYAPPFNGPAMAKALEGLPPGESTNSAVTTVAAGWGAADPLAALAWAAGYSDAGLREKAAGAAVEAWAKEDAWGASQWLDAQPPGEQRDVAAHHLARVLRTDDPESAWIWAGSISDPATRMEARAAVLRKWRDSSAADAQAAVEKLSADLPGPEQQKFTDTLNHKDAPK